MVRAIIHADGSGGVVPAAQTAPTAPTARDTTITRLAVLKAAAEYTASKPESKSTDVLKIAACWERWVLQSDDLTENLAEAFQ